MSVPVDKVVLVSSSGSTNSALEKAEAFGMEALTPEQDISRYGPLAKLGGIEVAARSVRLLRLVDGVAHMADREDPVAVASETDLLGLLHG
jgi:hypothetical protein